MTRLWIFLFSVPLLASVLPDRYILELTGESAAQMIARAYPPNQRRAALLGGPGRQARATVRRGQAAVRRRLAGNSARVIGSVDTVANLLFVNIPEAQSGRLQVPGVRRVLPERTYQLTLDHALPLHKVPDAWNLGGAWPQGAGVKIAMIDTGIDASHPGFKDTGFGAPPGFPLTTVSSDVKYTNHKIIVARSYVSKCLNKDPDTSAQDDQGHGTSTAMTAAGVQNTGPLATITGVAPQAWLGNYKIFGSPGVNDEANSCSVDMAINDAVNDGMDVINLSLGGLPAPVIESDDEVGVVENAVSMGVVVVISAGNAGPDPNTIGSPGTAPDAITAGAMNNDRYFANPFSVGKNGPYPAVPAFELLPNQSITAPLVDLSHSLDTTGLACGPAPLPANSLKGSMALILRGTCTFAVKLNLVQQAGAFAALVYTNQSQPDAITMDVGDATLPAEMVSYQDGLSIKQLLTGGQAQATMSFSQAPFAMSAFSIADFSSRGPNVNLFIKPDLLAVGEYLYTAAETTDPGGELYSPDGYILSQGTSYSAPLLTGAAAVLKAARPGLTPLQYKSLLVNSAAQAFGPPAAQQPVQYAGAGFLDLSAAVRSTLSLYPSSISFGVGSGSTKLNSSLRLSNIGYSADTFRISVSPAAGAPAVVPASTSIQLGSDTFFDLSLTFNPAGVSAGEYEGFINIQSANTGMVMRVPYWYGVASTIPAHITLLSVTSDTPKAGSQVKNAFGFQITDASGILVDGVTPTVTAIQGGGSVSSVNPAGSDNPGLWLANVVMGPGPGANNVFQVAAGGLTTTVTITAQ